VLTGAVWLTPEPEERPLSARLRVALGPRSWVVSGTLQIGGCPAPEPLSGVLLPPGHRDWTFRYRLALRRPDGEGLELRADLCPRWNNPVSSITTIPGRIVASDGREVAALVWRWDLRHDALSFLRSWRRDRC
jgi:hypothetical protein